MVKIRIENVVASSSLAEALDLQSISLELDGAEFEPARFPGVIYRLKEPKTAILLFHSGKLVCTGAKSMREVENAIATVAKRVKKIGQRINMHPRIEVQNIVASSDLESEVNLNAIAVTLGLDRVESEPEQFPGLVCRIDEPKVVVLLFGSGKLVITGARKPSDLEVAVKGITKELQGAGLLRRGRGPANPAPNRSSRSSQPSTAIPASPSPDPARPSEASATPTALVASSSTDPPRAKSGLPSNPKRFVRPRLSRPAVRPAARRARRCVRCGHSFLYPRSEREVHRPGACFYCRRSGGPCR